MSAIRQTIAIGNVLRAELRSFVVASRIPAPEVPTFGAFVRAPIQQGTAELIGLVYDIRLLDDPFLRNLAATVVPGIPEYDEIIRDQRENRAVPVEISVAAVGYRYSGMKGYTYGYPPQPPMVLHQIEICSADEVREITSTPDFMRALLDNPDLPADELIPTVLLRTAPDDGDDRRRALIEAGRYLARHLGRDPMRLEKVLRRIDGS
jgi:hypothetical protein